MSSLETTATFDPEKDEFVINTPHPRAAKWWPGELGNYANHAIVFAKLIIDESSFGVVPFMVQLRDFETHKLLPGIKTGDMGPKFNYCSKNNGWAIFTNVRVPRENLLNRYVSVDREGTFSIEGDIRVLYSVMMAIRM